MPEATHEEGSSARISRALAAVLLVVALSVLAGWALRIELLKSVVPGFVAMNPVTAVNFLALAFALLGIRPAGRPLIARSLGLLVATIAATKLYEHLGGVPIGIDQWLFSAELHADALQPPNRMAPNTAASQLALGVSIALIGVRVGRWHPSELLALGAAVPSLFALVGYIYGVRSFYRVGPFVPMAVHTACSLFLTAWAVVFASPEHATGTLLLRRSLAGLMMRRLVPAGLCLPALVGWMRLEGQRRDLYSNEVGVALFAVTVMLIFLTLVFLTARSIEQVDALRVSAQEQLQEVALHLARSNEKLERLATTDSLTNVLNRRAWMERLKVEIARARRHATPLSVLMIDADHFKRINDGYGHAVGDRALQEMAQLFVAQVREIDVVGRYGGEEFCVLLPDTHADGALVVAERLRSAVRALDFRASATDALALRCSIGVATLNAQQTTPAELLRAADTALYAAKSSRDCVRVTTV